MASLISSINRHLGRYPQVRVNLTGLDYSGKTSLLYRLKFGENVKVIPTIGFNVETIRVASEGVDLTMWDISGGCGKIHTVMWDSMKGPDNLYLFLIDITDSARADEALHDLAFLLRSAEAKYVAVVFNKCDLKTWEDPEVQEVVARVKEVVQLYKSDVKFQCDVYDDLTKFSVATGEQTDVLLDRLAHVAAAKKKNVHQSLVAKKQQPIANPEPPRPSKEELLEKIHLSHANSMLPPAEFMSQMVAGELENWDHRSHLRAGFLTLLECLHKKSVVVDATDLFLDRLDRMLKSAPGKFRNTSHRTLTTFWLHQIYFLILSYRTTYGSFSFPDPEEFDAFLATYPDLMYGRLWTSYYTNDLLFSPEAKETWRLPDLEPLPQFLSLPEEKQVVAAAEHEIKKPFGNAYILKRFAYAIVKTCKSTNRRRAAVINETLPAIQSHLVRLRATSPQVFEPYSQTQAYFWIQMLHAAIESMPPSFALGMTKLSFESFTILFPELLADDNVWKEHYSPARWNSIEARMRTILPDLKPLPNVVQAPDENRVNAAVSSTVDEKYSAEKDTSTLYGRPSTEELFMEVRWAVKQTTDRTAGKGAESPPETHAELIRRIFDRLVAVDPQSTEKATNTLSTAAWDAVSFLHERNRFTHAVFWSQMVLNAFMRMDASFRKQVTQCRVKPPGSEGDAERTQLFSRFLSGSPELCWDGLWRLHYSDEVWRSADAGRMYILPDKRKIPAYVNERNVEPDVELGDWELVDTMGPSITGRPPSYAVAADS